MGPDGAPSGRHYTPLSRPETGDEDLASDDLALMSSALVCLPGQLALAAFTSAMLAVPTMMVLIVVRAHQRITPGTFQAVFLSFAGVGAALGAAGGENPNEVRVWKLLSACGAAGVGSLLAAVIVLLCTEDDTRLLCACPACAAGTPTRVPGPCGSWATGALPVASSASCGVADAPTRGRERPANTPAAWTGGAP